MITLFYPVSVHALHDNSILPCECTGSVFEDNDHNHITAVSSKFISKNKKLRKLTYSENRTADYQKNKKITTIGISHVFNVRAGA